MATTDDNANAGQDNTAAQNTANQQQGKQFTQADIDAIVEDRLGRDRRTREEALAKDLGMSIKDAKALIKARKAEEDAQKSELQRERDARAKAEAERDALRLSKDLEKWQAKYGRKNNIPESDWDRLRGSTESEIEEDAKLWAKSRGLDRAGGPTPKGSGQHGEITENDAMNAAFRSMARGGSIGR